MNDISTAADLTSLADRYAVLVEHTPTPVWLVDSRNVSDAFERLRADGVTDITAHLAAHPAELDAILGALRVVEANRAAVSLLRANDPAELMRSIRPLFAGAPGLAARVLAAWFERRRDFSGQGRLATFDGDVRDVMISVSLVRDDTTFISVQDITEQLRIEAQLCQLRADFAHAARVSTLGELATSIAHEIRQPLAAIVTNAETSLRWLARDEANLPKVAELNGRIAASAQRASDIVQRVRGMALKRRPERAVVDLSDVIEDALHFVQHDLDRRGIWLSVSVAEALRPVNGDRVQLQQVVVNLLVNAIHAIDQAASAERRIEMRAEAASADAASLTVHDSGLGIREADAARLFEGFFTTKAGGMGIGLSICRSIVAEHGGDISAANHPAGGALFRVVLPFAEAAR